MKKKRLIQQVYPSHLLVVVLSVTAVTWYAATAIRAFHDARTGDELASAAHLAAESFKTIAMAEPPDVQAGRLDFAKIDAACKSLGKGSGYRLTFVLPSGKVIGDSEEEPETMESHGDRPEIRDAFSKGTGIATRYSHTLGKNMMYVAVPVTSDGKTGGAIRVSLPLTAIHEALRTISPRIGIAGAIIACLAALTSMIVARRISRPLEELRGNAEAVGRGGLPTRLAVSGILEIDELAITLNRMADELNERIDTITRQRDEQNALFSCMIESVIAVDTEKRLIRMNKSAEQLLIADAAHYGRNIMEVIRNTDLLEIIDRTLASSEPVESTIFIFEGNRYLQAHGTSLQGADGRRIGALIVLNDITRLRRLEIVRRDFVANVSHELRTPVTSIKGFLETVLSDAGKNQPQADKFLRIAARQADRLNAIIEDLLVLSRLEQADSAESITLETAPVRDALESAIQACEHKAVEKGIAVELQCPPQLAARINAPLLEQAVINLVDNAVKYSPANSRVSVEGCEESNATVIRVRDQGCGIEARHLPRVFERFYRVDKSRSKSLGGTGLGLAIVKHIAIAHNGSVAAESEPDKGSVFSISLPRAEQPPT